MFEICWHVIMKTNNKVNQRTIKIIAFMDLNRYIQRGFDTIFSDLDYS